MTGPVNIIGAGCAFPSGPTLPLADCALRAQMALLKRHPVYTDRCGFPVRANYFPDSPFWFDAERWCALAASVLEELVGGLGDQPVGLRCQLWLVLPHSGRGGVPVDLLDRLFERLGDSVFDWERIHTVHGGHAVGVHAVRQAAQAVSAEQMTAVVLAVDSWLHPEALQVLEHARLLHAAHSTHEGKAVPNPYGRVPGEGAAAVALAPITDQPAAWTEVLHKQARHPKMFAPRAWVQLSAAEVSEEPLTFDQSKPCIGQGLASAAGQALVAAGTGLVHRISTDINSEPYRADELGFATLRLAEALAPGWTRTTPVTVSGDLGAASAIVQLALASYGMCNRPTAKAERQLILCSSDNTLRAAMVVDSLPQAKPT